jgi:Domain of unknown function (DUF202)
MSGPDSTTRAPRRPDPSADADSRARERTALAWNRSALAVATTGGLLIKIGVDGGSPVTGLVGGGSLLALAAAVWAYSAVTPPLARSRGGLDLAAARSRGIDGGLGRSGPRHRGHRRRCMTRVSVRHALGVGLHPPVCG